jgi:hypothetical protein
VRSTHAGRTPIYCSKPCRQGAYRQRGKRHKHKSKGKCTRSSSR